MEKWLGDVALLELKRRAHKMTVAHMEDSLKLLKQDVHGRRPKGETLNPMALMVKSHSEFASGRDGTGGNMVVWPCTNFAIASQKVYSTFYGSKSLSCRKLVPKTLEQMAEERNKASRSHLGRVPKQPGERTVAGRLDAHQKSISAGVEALKKGSCTGPLGNIVRENEGGGVSTSAAMPAMVAAVSGIASEREKSGAAAAGTAATGVKRMASVAKAGKPKRARLGVDVQSLTDSAPAKRRNLLPSLLSSPRLSSLSLPSFPSPSPSLPILVAVFVDGAVVVAHSLFMNVMPAF